MYIPPYIPTRRAGAPAIKGMARGGRAQSSSRQLQSTSSSETTNSATWLVYFNGKVVAKHQNHIWKHNPILEKH